MLECIELVADARGQLLADELEPLLDQRDFLAPLRGVDRERRVHIRSIDVDQSFFKRLLGIGDLTISTSATVEASEILRSIPDPRGLRDLILAQRDRT